MEIQYCSDLHLEFQTNINWIKENPLIPKAEILLIAGDTCYLEDNFIHHPFFDIVSKQFKMVYLIPGNHEFYNGFDSKICLELGYEIKIRKNVFLVNNFIKKINEVNIIFSTLWSNIQKEKAIILTSMNDFRYIYFNGKKLSIDQFNNFHLISWKFIKNSLKLLKNEKNIVVSHHLPSIKCNLEQYKNSKLNEAFCVDLTSEIEDLNPQFWIYGHSHGNKPTFKINDTEMLCNQLGYVDFHEHKSFERDKTLII